MTTQAETTQVEPLDVVKKLAEDPTFGTLSDEDFKKYTGMDKTISFAGIEVSLKELFSKELIEAVKAALPAALVKDKKAFLGTALVCMFVRPRGTGQSANKEVKALTNQEFSAICFSLMNFLYDDARSDDIKKFTASLHALSPLCAQFGLPWPACSDKLQEQILKLSGAAEVQRHQTEALKIVGEKSKDKRRQAAAAAKTAAP